MSKVIMFSRVFPAYHPKAGQPTYFMEKIYKYLDNIGKFNSLSNETYFIFDEDAYNNLNTCKSHTIRAGHRWKEGDKFSPRVWSGKPYHSKQIIIAPDIEVEKVWNFEMTPRLWADECLFSINNYPCSKDDIIEVAKNDGLDIRDFVYWFTGGNIASSSRKPFIGQVICWNPEIRY